MLKRIILLLGLLIPLSASAANNPADIPSVASITELRAKPALFYPTVYLTQYNSTTRQGGGTFEYTGSSSCTDDSGVLIQAVGGCYKRLTNDQPWSISWFGAQCGGIQVTDGVSVNTSHTLTSASNKFTAGMVGWVAVVNKAASSSNQLVTTVSGFTNSGSITLTATAGASNSTETVSLYPDDTTAINNTVSSANLYNVPVTLPSGQTCGYANPGSYQTTIFKGPGLYLDGGTLWLGQTGPTSNTGYGIHFWGEYSVLKGPGVIDGLYQTNQGISQTNIDAVVFESGGSPATVLSNNFLSSLTIQNTKGRAFSSLTPTDMTISDVNTVNCGDYIFQNSGTPGDMTGRSMCGQIENPQGFLHISNYSSVNAAQSGLLVDNLSFGTYDPNVHVVIHGCTTIGAGYYGLDFEDIAGRIDTIGCTMTNTVTPAGVLINGGYISRNVKNISIDNLQTNGIDSPAVVVETTGSDGNQYETTNVTISNLNLVGSSSIHGARLFLSTTGDLVPARWYVSDARVDSFTTFTSGQACAATSLQQMLLSFSNLTVSHQFTGTYDTTFEQQGAPSTMFYVKGSGDIGRVAINSLGSNQKATLYDLSGAYMNSTSYPVFTGSTSTATYTSTTLANPNNNPGCP